MRATGAVLHAGRMNDRSTAVASWVMVAVGVAAGVLGLLASWASNCCGSPDPADPTPAVLGVVLGAVAWLVAWGLRAGWSGGLVLGLAAVLPVGCLVVGLHSTDAAGLAPFAALGWVGLAVLLWRRR